MVETKKLGTLIIVDDDETVREIIKDQLEDVPFNEVLLAKDGVEAQELIEIKGDQVTLVISDMKMPRMHGIELFHWVKRRSEKLIPFIMITGFEEVIDSQEAYALGVKDFIVKPFDQDMLVNKVQHAMDLPFITKEVDPVNIDKEYFKITLKEFITGSRISYSIYLRLSESKIIKIANKGDLIDRDQIDRYRDKNVKYIYMKMKDYKEYVSLILKASRVVGKHKKLSMEKKESFLAHASETILEYVFNEEIKAEDFVGAKAFMEGTLDTLTSGPETFDLLKTLQNCGDYVYAHSLACSVYSVMVARKMEWHTEKTLSIISMGAFFHDIGKKKISEENRGKMPGEVDCEEFKKEYANHPVYGVELLNQIEQIPKEVLQIIMQHHENTDGSGFPFGLMGPSIYPPAALVGVVNKFCHKVIPSKEGQVVLSPKQALEETLIEEIGTTRDDILDAFSQLIFD